MGTKTLFLPLLVVLFTICAAQSDVTTTPGSLDLASGSNPQTSIEAFWQPPITDNLDGYRLTYEPTDGDNSSPMIYDKNTRVATLSGLTPSTTYNVTIQTIFGNMSGRVISAEFTTASGTEGEIIVKEATIEDMFLAFVGYQNAETYGVDLQLSGVNVVDTVRINSTSSSFTYRFTNLIAGTTYTVKLIGGGKETEAEVTTVPLPPTNLSVEGTPTSSRVTLSWIAASGADRYDIFYSFDDVTETRIQASTVSSPTTTITTLRPGIEYTFEVVAVVGQGENIRISEVVTITATTAMSDITVTATTDTVTATWSSVENTQNYSVYYSPSDGDQDSPFVLDAVTTSLTGLTPGEMYQVGVKANFANGTIQIIGIAYIRTAPLSPEDVVLAKDVDSFTLTWAAPMAGLYSSFEIYYFTIGGTVTDTYTLILYDDVRTKTITGLVPVNQYFWFIQTKSGSSNEFSYSDVVSATVNLDTPTSGDIFIESVTETVIEVAFQSTVSDRVTGYQLSIMPEDSASSNNRTFTPEDNNYHAFLGLTPGTDYTISLRILGTGEPNKSATVTTKPLAPQFVQTTSSNFDSLVITWDAPIDTTNLDYYSVSYRPNIGIPQSPILIDISGNRLRRNVDDTVTLEIEGLTENTGFDITVSSIKGSSSQDVFITALTGSLESGEFYITNVMYESFQITYGETTDPSFVEYTFNIMGGNQMSTFTRSAFADRSFLVEGLQHSTLYYVELIHDGVNPTTTKNVTTEIYVIGEVNVTFVNEKRIEFIWDDTTLPNFFVSFTIEPEEGTANIDEVTNSGQVSGLTPGKLYYLSIFNNTETDERWSVVAVRTYPERPTGFGSYIPGITSIFLSWNMDSDTVYDYFRVTYEPANGVSPSPIDVTATEIMLEGLIPITDYRIEVRTVSGDGDNERISQKNAGIDLTTGSCDAALCLNGGMCQAVGYGFQCQCSPFYSGDVCEFEPDPPYVSTHPLSNRVSLNTSIYLYCKIEYSSNWQWFKDGVPLANSLNKEEISILMTIDAQGYYGCSGSGVGPHKHNVSSSVTASLTVIGVSTFPVTLTFLQLVFTESLQDPSSSDFQEISATITGFLDDESLPDDPYVQVRSLRKGSVVTDSSFYVYNLNVSQEEYISILMAALEEIGINSVGFLNPDSIIISSADVCFEQVYVDFTFPDAFVGQTVDSKEECDETRKYYGQPLANRTCIGDRLSTAEWHPMPMINDCGGEATAEDLLERIIYMNVTEDNVEEISVEVYEITLETDEITEGALENVAIILQEIVSVDSNSTLVTSSMVGTVDNLFSIDEDILMDSQMITQAPTSIILSLEEQLGQVELKNGIYQESMQNIAVLGQMLNVGDVSNSGLTFGAAEDVAGLEDITTLQRGMIPNDVQVSIDLPASISSTIMKAKGSNTFRVVVIAYETSKLFQSPQFDSSLRRPNGPVISFSVPGVEPVMLDDPLTTTFIPTEITEENDDTECVFWDFELIDGVGGWSSEGCIFISGSADGSDRQYCECNHLTNFAVLMNFYSQTPVSPASEIITKIGLSLSITGLSLTLLTFITNKNLRKSEPKKILCNLCASLLCLYIVFLAGIDQKANESRCTAVGALLHYFLLSSIFWMSVQALLMYYLFVRIYDSHIPRFLLKASLFAWGAPAVIVLATIFVDIDDYVDEKEHCFLTLGRMYVSVAIPVAIALLFNVFMFILVMHSVSTHGKFAKQQRKKKEGFRMLQNGISITLVMGLTWLFGFFAIGEASKTINILFCVFNSLQGFLIFMMYCVRNKEVRNYWRHNLIKLLSSPHSSKPSNAPTDFALRAQ